MSISKTTTWCNYQLKGWSLAQTLVSQSHVQSVYLKNKTF